ncbi:hypothetical protein H8356DRAFT_1426898 [Neocallimastix lanati (nom. inval.)]|nr:hypothetical protein H8356DRAFT_1426898 [Neocallimastix sp. JGI-2020a]
MIEDDYLESSNLNWNIDMSNIESRTDSDSSNEVYNINNNHNRNNIVNNMNSSIGENQPFLVRSVGSLYRNYVSDKGCYSESVKCVITRSVKAEMMRRFGHDIENIILIFIHDLESWTEILLITKELGITLSPLFLSLIIFCILSLISTSVLVGNINGWNSEKSSFCGVKRSLGSIYVPSKKHKDSKDKGLFIPPIASICIKKKSSWIISHLVKNISTLSHYSWTKKKFKFTKPYIKSKLISENFLICYLVVVQQLIPFRGRFDDNIFSFKYCILCLLLGENAVYKILKIVFFTNFIFYGLVEFPTNAIPIVINDFYTMINLYIIRSTVVKSVDVETIRQRRYSNIHLNDIKGHIVHEIFVKNLYVYFNNWIYIKYVFSIKHLYCSSINMGFQIKTYCICMPNICILCSKT